MGKRTKGNRDRSGRRKRPSTTEGRATAPDYGNDRVKARRALFEILAGGKRMDGQDKDGRKVLDEIDGALGQAFAAGLLDGFDADPLDILTMGKNWLRYHRDFFGTGYRTANLERLGRAEPNPNPTFAQRRYLQFMRVEQSLSAKQRTYMNMVCIEYGDGWALPPFIERMINERLVKRKAYCGGYLPIRGDREKLEACVEGLLELARGSGKEKQAA